MITIDLGVSVLADTVSSATAGAAEAASRILSALRDRGVDETSIATTDYTIHPEFEYRNDSQRMIGYRVNNTLRAKTPDIAGAGGILDAAATAGGDATRVNGVSFSLDDERPLLEAARTEAWKDAVSKATQLAGLAGRGLGQAVSITESVGAPPMPVRFAAMESADMKTPIQPGSTTVSVTIEVVFDFGS